MTGEVDKLLYEKAGGEAISAYCGRESCLAVLSKRRLRIEAVD